MKGNLVVDTDLLIDFLRGRPQATDFLRELTQSPMVSTLSIAELFAGVRDAERDELDAFLTALTPVPVTEEIARRGGLYRRDYGPSHGTGLIDGIVAATAQAHSARLATLNRRHYPMLESEVVVPY